MLRWNSGMPPGFEVFHMAAEKDSGMKSGKAFKQRSVLLLVLKICLIVVVLAAVALGAMALLFKDTWRDMTGWASTQVETGRVKLFRHLAVKFVNQSDLIDADKTAWNGLIERMSDDMLQRKGDDGQREQLRGFFDRIAESMKDDELRSAELEPMRKDLEKLLADIELQEKVKQG